MRIRLRTWPDEADATFILPAGEVQIWRAARPPASTASGEFDRFLSHDEWARAARLLAPGKRHQFKHSHGLLRVLLGRYLNHSPGELRLASHANGKPFLDALHLPPIHFSLSHTEGLALFAFGTQCALGIDVEAVADLPDCDALAALALSDREFFEFRALPTGMRPQAFLRYWTAKEACLKALGRGLSLDPRRVELNTPSRPVGVASVTEDDQDGRTEWQFRIFEPAPRFVASVAWQQTTTDTTQSVMIGFASPHKPTAPLKAVPGHRPGPQCLRVA